MWASVPNRFLRISVLFLLSVSRSFMNSPCASMTIWPHWAASMPRMSTILLVTSLGFLATVSPFMDSSAVGAALLLSPERPTLMYGGSRTTSYTVPRCSNSRDTIGLDDVRSLCRVSVFLLVPLVSPYSAYVIASKIIVFPDPVFPVIRNRPPPILVKSTVVGAAYGPKASILSLSGFIRNHLLSRCIP